MTASRIERGEAYAREYGRDRSYVTPKAERRQSPIGGSGLFAIEPIAKGELICRDAGRVITVAEFHALPEIYQRMCYTLDEDFFLCPFDFENPSGEWFLNHCCEANTGVTPDRANIAIRDIAAGEELTYDYATTECEEDWELERPCNCGSAVCRGRITGNDWKLADVQARYAGFFSPYVAAIIAAQ